jgi:hypothetical protein
MERQRCRSPRSLDIDVDPAEPEPAGVGLLQGGVHAGAEATMSVRSGPETSPEK